MKTLWDQNYTDFSKLDKWFYGSASLNGKTRQWLVDEIRALPENSTVLDAGSGGGVTPFQLNQAGILNKIKYVGIDFSNCMIEFAKTKVNHANITWVHSSLERIDLPKKFDYVIVRAVLEHIFDPLPAIRSLANMVKPNGRLTVIFWNNPVHNNRIEKVVTGGFYDISHNYETLLNEFVSNNLTLVDEIRVEEKSVNDNFRLIWKFRSNG